MCIQVCIYIYMLLYMRMCVNNYVCESIYIYRERERERERDIYIYTLVEYGIWGPRVP